MTSVPSTTLAGFNKVLVIEDEQDARENLRDILELDDFPVVTAATAAEALAREDWGELAAVILDRRLPDGDAQDLLPRLKLLAPDAAVIIVTGYSDLEGAIEALRLGAADYILKPINADSLRLRVSRVVEQRQLAKAKERSDAIFRDLVEVSEVMIVMVRSDNSIVYFSPFAEQLTGYRASAVMGQNYLDLFVFPDDRAVVAERHRRALAGEPIRGVEVRIVSSDGAPRWVLKNARALKGYDGGDILLIVQHDLQERKQAEVRLLQSERLAAIGHMVAGLAHESRNALQRIQACLDMLRLRVTGVPGALDLIGRIQNAQDDLQHLFEDVRNYAAPIKLERHRVELASVWREAWNNLTAVRRHPRATLTERSGCLDLVCEIDPFRIGQVFRNVFDNALAACPASRDPIVEVACEPARLDAQPAIRVSVRDNGPGLNLEEQVKIFESFYTTKTKGTGLGMAIVKRIVEAHGGRITVGTSSGPGAEIVMTLPRGAE
ncbi:MAG: PAS domain S-box protein [Isosphaeraceae bacterium]